MMGLAALLAAGSAVTAYAEILPLFRSGSAIEQKLDALTAGALPPGPSYKSRMLVLSDCNAALSSAELNALAPDAKQAALQNCRRMADDILAQEPSFSFAWYIDAFVADRLGEFPAISTSLVQSQLTGARAQWLAQSRVYIASRNVTNLTPAALAAYKVDLATIVESNRSRPWLAEFYRQTPDAQALITDVVETLSPELQRRFVSAVRRASQ